MTYQTQTLQQIALAALCGIGIAVVPAIAHAETPVAASTTHSEVAQAPGNIVEVASSDDNFETLVAAVEAAELADTLASDGPFTVFAPTDAAFDELPDDALAALLEPENQDLLTDILLYHVVPGEVTSDELETGGVDTLNGGLAVSVLPDRIVVNNGSVIAADVPASNGVIHAINRVLIPEGTLEELQARMGAAPEPIPGLW